MPARFHARASCSLVVTFVAARPVGFNVVVLLLSRTDTVGVCGFQILKKEPRNAKALFRRGQAYLEQGHLDKAEADLREAEAIAPGDAGIRRALARLARKNAQYMERQKKKFAGTMASEGFDFQCYVRKDRRLIATAISFAHSCARPSLQCC